MQALNLPTYQFTIKEEEGKKKIFDRIRKKMVALTPEEWVRQNFILYLVKSKGYPASMISVEALVVINGLSQRSDIVIYNRQRLPTLIVECKAPTIKITQAVFEQVLRYNIKLKTQLICVTNGLQHYCAQLHSDGVGFNFLEEIPAYKKEDLG